MFTKRIHLFTLLGFRIGADLTWIPIAILVAWSLSTAYFPAVIQGLAPAGYLLLGVVGALGFFASIVFHELAHALVARRFNMPISGITLFLFGGVAELTEEPPNPKAEFLVAIAGPISSFLLAGASYAIALALPGAAPFSYVSTALLYLAALNAVLAIFNLLPAFPLDGGRVLRAALWWWTDDLRRATYFSALLGRGLGAALVGLGVLNVVAGNFVGGMWQGLIGLFIIGAAGASEMQLEAKLGLKDVPVSRLMTPKPIAAPADAAVQSLVDDYFYRYFHKVFPVVRQDGPTGGEPAGGELIGCVRLEDVAKVKREDWPRTPVSEIVQPESANQTIEATDSVFDAMLRMQRRGLGRLMVVERRKLKGILTMRDIMDFLAIRLQLDDNRKGDLETAALDRQRRLRRA